MLYLVPTPIGNLEDITLRSLETLRTVDKILSEDTRQTGKLLSHFEISSPQQSFHAHNEHQLLSQIILELKSGKNIALVSDAGTPGISDPGYLLIRECVQENIPLTCLPGPSAIIPALVGSGIPCDRFYFEGFLPAKKGRTKRLKAIAELDQTIILYESPHRIHKTIKQLREYLDDGRLACIAREISKIHEEFIRGSLQDLDEQLEERSKLKGEITVIVEGKA